MNMRFATLAAVIVLMSLVSACGGDSATKAGRSVSADTLAEMVLSRDDLGPDFSHLIPLQSASGALGNERFAGELPSRSVQDLERYGRLDGHRQVYIARPHDELPGRIVGISVEVGLFRTDEGASGFLRDHLALLRGDVAAGTAPEHSLTEHESAPLGDEHAAGTWITSGQVGPASPIETHYVTTSSSGRTTSLAPSAWSVLTMPIAGAWLSIWPRGCMPRC